MDMFYIYHICMGPYNYIHALISKGFYFILFSNRSYMTQTCHAWTSSDGFVTEPCYFRFFEFSVVVGMLIKS